MTVIKILGTGCKKCQTLETKVKDLLESNGINAEVEKVTDIKKIIEFGIMITPALVVDDVVICSGIIPKDDQILNWVNGGEK